LKLNIKFSMVRKMERFRKMKIIDLTMPIHEQMPVFPGHARLKFRVTHRFEEYGYFVSAMEMSCHTGTHIDAPYHIYDKGKGESPYMKFYEIPLERLMGDAICFEIPKGEVEGVTVGDLERAEKKFGEVYKGDIVIIHTGWDERHMEDAFYNRHSFIMQEAAEWLVKRGIKLLGTDIIDIDNPTTSEKEHWPTHRLMFRNNIVVIENHVNLSKISGKRVYYIALPLKLMTIPDGCPVRAVALLEE